MKILIVATDYFNESNGLCISTQRFIKCFRERGHEVRVVTNNKKGVPDYPLEVYKVPVFNKIIEKEGYTFAKKNEHIITEALEWCDIVHLEDPFPLGKYTSKLALKMKKPCTATFHLYPENMTYSAGIKWMHIDYPIMRYFRSAFKRCVMIQCPTELVKARLIKYHFKNNLVVVSNGIAKEAIQNERLEKPDNLKDKFIILSTGRYSREKNQAELLKALALSKYKDNIKVLLTGKGPLEEELKNLAIKNNLDVDFGFYSQDDLKKIRGYSDIFIHCAKVEVEGMACMEAFASGVVPIIAKNELSSTWAYSISDNNMYESGNLKDLVNKINYWYENKDELELYRKKYYDMGQNLLIDKSADIMLEKFDEIVNKNIK